MKIIGHRGAAGLELENTIVSLKKAVSLGVDAIEFDVHITRDRQLVLSHDPDLSRVSNSHAKIESLDLAELKRIKLRNGESVPTLSEALIAVGKVQPIIEVKIGGCANELLKVIDKFPKINPIVACRDFRLAEELKKRRPSQPVYLVGFINPNDTFETARLIGADGLDINAWALNILVYKLALRRGLRIMVYTVNQPWVAWFINRFYPEAWIVSDSPDKLLRLRAHAK